MLLAPLFGYLGDRYERKWIIIFGVGFWSLTTLLGAFVPNDVRSLRLKSKFILKINDNFSFFF